MDLRLPNRSGRKDDRTRERVHIHYWVSMNGYKEVLIALKCSRNNNVHENIHVLSILYVLNLLCSGYEHNHNNTSIQLDGIEL